jgi:hypothetical protein
VVKSELAKLRTFAMEQAKNTAEGPEQQAFYSASIDQMAGRGGGNGGGAAAEGAGGRRPTSSATTIPAGAPIEPDLTFLQGSSFAMIVD